MSVADEEKPSVWQVVPSDDHEWSEGALKDIDGVRKALQAGADPSEEGAINKAVMDDNIDIVVALYEAGADPFDYTDDAERNVLHHMWGEHVTEFLLERAPEGMIDEPDINGHTPLMDAVAGGDYDKVRVLLDAGADVYASDDDQWNAMHYAASYRADESIIELLLDADEDNELFDLRDAEGNTPWDLAEEEGQADTIRSVIAQREKTQITEALAEHMTPSELYAQDDVQQAPSCEVRQKARRAM